MARSKYSIPDQKSVTCDRNAEEIALICGVSLRTACRWKAGAVEMDAASKMILAGDLGCFDRDWHGWTLRHGCLVSPEGWEITMSDVLASRLHEAQLSEWRRQVSIMKDKVAELERGQYEDQPNPEELGEICIKVG